MNMNKVMKDTIDKMFSYRKLRGEEHFITVTESKGKVTTNKKLEDIPINKPYERLLFQYALKVLEESGNCKDNLSSKALNKIAIEMLKNIEI